MKHYKLYALKPVSGGRGNRTSLNNSGGAASVRNACDPCHAICHVQSGLGVQTFKYYWRLHSRPASPSSPVSNLNPSWTPNPYLKPQCHPSLELRLCIGALPAWAAQPAAAASRLFLMTTNRQQCITRSSQCNKSMHGIKAVTVQLNTRPQHIGEAWLEPVEHLAPGAPNQRQPAAQVP